MVSACVSENDKLRAGLLEAISYLKRLPPVPVTLLKIRELETVLEGAGAAPIAEEFVGSWELCRYTPAGSPISLGFFGAAFTAVFIPDAFGSARRDKPAKVDWKLSKAEAKALRKALDVYIGK